MKRKLGCLLLCAMLVCAAAVHAEDYAEAFRNLGESEWYGSTTDEERVEMAWELLFVFRYAGYPVGGIPAGDFAQAMNDQYDVDKSPSIWDVALGVLGEKLEEMDETQYFPVGDVAYYAGLGENDWYGDTTDDERIAMAWDLLNIIRAPGFPAGGIGDADMAQAMNNYFDQDKSLSVWDVALLVVEPMLPEDGTLPMPTDYSVSDAGYYEALDESDWYGENTDQGRVDMAWELLCILRKAGHTTGHTCPNDFAQAMNDFYDQDKSLSIWEVALEVL